MTHGRGWMLAGWLRVWSANECKVLGRSCGVNACFTRVAAYAWLLTQGKKPVRQHHPSTALDSLLCLCMDTYSRRIHNPSSHALVLALAAVCPRARIKFLDKVYYFKFESSCW